MRSMVTPNPNPRKRDSRLSRLSIYRPARDTALPNRFGDGRRWPVGGFWQGSSILRDCSSSSTSGNAVERSPSALDAWLVTAVLRCSEDNAQCRYTGDTYVLTDWSEMMDVRLASENSSFFQSLRSRAVTLGRRWPWSMGVDIHLVDYGFRVEST